MQSERSLAQQHQQQIFATGSFSGFQRLGELGHGYLTQSTTGHQPFCGNAEGWGPWSQHRYDLTPCALDAVVSSVALYGILFGAAAIWYLVKRRTAQEVKRDLHFWTKQVGLRCLLPSSYGSGWRRNTRLECIRHCRFLPLESGLLGHETDTYIYDRFLSLRLRLQSCYN